MRTYRLRSDLERAVVDGFALPLGVVPANGVPMKSPTIGYTIDYTPGQDDNPDSYSIYAVASHERMSDLVRRCFEILPYEVYPFLEIGSRDAYRALDIYMAREPVPREAFQQSWMEFEPFVLEDGSIGCGANADDPFVEVFLDQWKGLTIHVPPLMRDDVEEMLQAFGLEEVLETWPSMDEDTANEMLRLRSVLAFDDEFSPSVDDVLLELRHAWDLELNIDAATNVDDTGRRLGYTLWHGVIIVESVRVRRKTGYVSVWATASSLHEMEELIDEAIEGLVGWRFVEIFTNDRVALDERPDALVSLPPKRVRPEVHLIESIA